jgi:hypothetical protein
MPDFQVIMRGSIFHGYEVQFGLDEDEPIPPNEEIVTIFTDDLHLLLDRNHLTRLRETLNDTTLHIHDPMDPATNTFTVIECHCED